MSHVSLKMLASSCNYLNIDAKPKILEDQLLLLNNSERSFIRLIKTIVFYYDLVPKVSDSFCKFFFLLILSLIK